MSTKNYRIGSGTSRLTGTFFFLYIFESTSLIETSFVQLDVLDLAFRYKLFSQPLTIEYWKEEGGTDTRDMKVTLQNLLDDCEEIRSFAKDFYPEYIL